MDAEPEPGAPRTRPALSLTVPFLLALAVWGLSHWHHRGAPPRAPSHLRMEENPVAVELRRFRTLSGPKERVQAIARIGPVRDPRVTVALMEVVRAEVDKGWGQTGEPPGVLLAASSALCEYHIPEAECVSGVKYWTGALMWWETHEAEVRQRASLLPQ